MKIYILSACLVLIALFSCNKPSDFGKEIVSGNNIPFEVIDTFSLLAESLYGDSVRMYVPGSITATASNSIVGYVEDSAFGKTSAEIFAQFVVTRQYDGNLSGATIDSVVWDVYYDDEDTTNQYGDLSKPMNLRLYRITENVDRDDTLYSNETFDVDGAEIGSLINFLPMPLPSDSSHIRFNLNSTFIDFIKGLPDTTFKNTTNLHEFFEGINIKADQTQSGSLIKVDLINPKNQLVIYFKAAGSDTQDSIKMATNSNVVRHTAFAHDYTNSKFQAYINNPASDSLLYLQSMGGPQIKLTLPDLSHLVTDAINVAELELTVAVENGTSYSPPSQLWLFKKNSSGALVSVIDGSVALSQGLTSSFGGTPEEFVVNNVTKIKYKIRIPKHLTDYINGKETNELYLSTLNAGSVPARVILNGPKTKVSPVKLKLIVSKVI